MPHPSKGETRVEPSAHPAQLRGGRPQCGRPGDSSVSLFTPLRLRAGGREWLGGGGFSVADAAVASYLNYVPIFHRGADLSKTPNTVQYMLRCAERPAFGEAFGAQHQALVVAKCNEWLSAGAGAGASGGGLLGALGLK